MGWLWSSSKEPSTSNPSSSSSTSPYSSPSTPPTTSSPAPPPPPPQDLTLNPPSPPITTTTPPPTTPPSTSTRTPITPTITLPSTLSCRTAFDAAFYCQSLGGQFSNIYRYGSLRSCSALWGDFWFCVRTNRGFMSEERKRETIRAWALRREREKYGGSGGDDDDDGEGGDGVGAGMEDGVANLGKGSSEDVWEARRWMVRGAFGGEWVGVKREVGEKVDSEMQKEVR